MRFYGEQSTYFPTLSVAVNDLGEGAVAALAGDLFNWRAVACGDCIDAAQVTNAKLQLGKTFLSAWAGRGQVADCSEFLLKPSCGWTPESVLRGSLRAGQDQRCAAAALGQRGNEHMLNVGGARLEV